MSTKPSSFTTKPNLRNPQLIFDAALADLNDDTCHRSTTVALSRTRPIRACSESTRLRRERALNEAADALAKLWRR